MLAPITQLLHFQDLNDPGRTSHLVDGDLVALRSLAGWITTFVTSPHKELGRAGPVCPFVPVALERRTLWLAAEHLNDRSATDVVRVMDHYRNVLLRAEPTEGDGLSYKALVIALTDLSAERAKQLLSDPGIQEFKRLSYAEDGVVIGEFHAENDGTAIRNPKFRPFRSPVPFLLIRHGVLSDWMFFLDNDEWLGAWGRRFGNSAFQTLAEQLRRTSWRRLESV